MESSFLLNSSLLNLLMTQPPMPTCSSVTMISNFIKENVILFLFIIIFIFLVSLCVIFSGNISGRPGLRSGFLFWFSSSIGCHRTTGNELFSPRNRIIYSRSSVGNQLDSPANPGRLWPSSSSSAAVNSSVSLLVTNLIHQPTLKDYFSVLQVVQPSIPPVSLLETNLIHQPTLKDYFPVLQVVQPSILPASPPLVVLEGNQKIK